MKRIHRGEVYYAVLDPILGSEQGGTRPVLILQNETGNRHSPTTIVAPITSKIKNKLPTHVYLEDFPYLPYGSAVLLEQLRTIDKQRLRDIVGNLDREDLQAIDSAIAVSLGIQRSSNIMTLCTHCYNEFKDSGSYFLRRIDHEQPYRETCTLCSVRTGYDFEVIKK